MLTKILDIKNNHIISIIGAGGKTTLMNKLAQELRSDAKVLVTTTTKIFLPDSQQFDFIAMGQAQLNHLKKNITNGITIYGSKVDDTSKIFGIKGNLKRELPFFDYILVEADGSRRKPLKGWNETEPVILEETDITIGVLSIQALGLKKDEASIHRLKEFSALTTSDLNEPVSIEDLLSVVCHKNGIFKNAIGRKVLFINQVETEEQSESARILCEKLRVYNAQHALIDRLIVGSLHLQHHRVVDITGSFGLI